jgi:hypothetical protein
MAQGKYPQHIAHANEESVSVIVQYFFHFVGNVNFIFFFMNGIINKCYDEAALYLSCCFSNSPNFDITSAGRAFPTLLSVLLIIIMDRYTPYPASNNIAFCRTDRLMPWIPQIVPR